VRNLPAALLPQQRAAATPSPAVNHNFMMLS
jgi:hypothetical protein